MRRRDLIPLIAAVVLGFSRAEAQQPRRRLIGTLTLGSRASVGWMFETLRQALAARGYGEDKIAIESRWAGGNVDRLPDLAAGLVGLSPEVIVAGQPVSAWALKRVTAKIPIVVAVSDNPVSQGLVESLAHPGGNITGLSFQQEDTVGRELQLLKTMVPSARRIAVLVDPNNTTHATVLPVLREPAASLKTEVLVVKIGNAEEIENAFDEMKSRHADAVLALGDALFTTERRRIIALAASRALPAIYHDHIFVEEGGLMSYGGDFGDNYRRAAVFVDKILKGAKPADLPIEQPTKFYLYINKTTAKALGLTVPQLLLTQADQVIE
jgi:ABC-type uncharacterized transport system substrate-binding protein